LRRRRDEILAANAQDLEVARSSGLAAAMIDRLALDPARVEAMARGVEEIARLADRSAACSRSGCARTGCASSACGCRSA